MTTPEERQNISKYNLNPELVRQLQELAVRDDGTMTPELRAAILSKDQVASVDSDISDIPQSHPRIVIELTPKLKQILQSLGERASQGVSQIVVDLSSVRIDSTTEEEK